VSSNFPILLRNRMDTMASDQIETVRRYQQVYKRILAHLELAKCRARQLCEQLPHEVRYDAREALFEIDLQTERLRASHQLILASTDANVVGRLTTHEYRLDAPETKLGLDIATKSDPDIIAAGVGRLVDVWVAMIDVRALVEQSPSLTRQLGRHSGSLEADSLSNVANFPIGMNDVGVPIPETSTSQKSISAITSSSFTSSYSTPERLWKAVSASASALAPVTTADWKAYRAHAGAVDPSLDPRLQVAVARYDSGSVKMALASIAEDEIAVVAEVTDVEKWEALSEVRVGARIGARRDSRNVSIVTARISISRIERVRKQPFVRSLTAARTVRPTLNETRSDMQLPPLPNAGVSNTGEGVVIGIVDFGCDFAHQNFRNDDGTTRIEALWVQAEPGKQGSVDYGRLYTRADINKALQTSDPYKELGYGMGLDMGHGKGSHGTHVMDIAAGNGRGSNSPGCAPGSTIVFVDLSVTDIPWSGPNVVGQSLGDSVRLLEAVDFIFETAGARPCVVNLSLGTDGGPHDGTTSVEQGLDDLINEGSNRAVVVAAGNSQDHNIHQQGNVAPLGTIDLQWKFRKASYGHEMEIWLPAGSHVAVEVISPDGTSGVVEPDGNLSLGSGSEVALYIANQLKNDANGDCTIGIYFAGTADPLDLIVRLHNREDFVATFHAWIERNDEKQSSFASATPSHTLGSISCGQDTICVGSYDAHKKLRTLSFFSSNGPTRDGREKPEISAPGHAVTAARSGSQIGVCQMSGTSMAAPAVTGLVALMYAKAVSEGKSISAADLRAALMQGATTLPVGSSGWDAGYGHGGASSKSLAFI
jgi:subtilisin family serine protease